MVSIIGACLVVIETCKSSEFVVIWAWPAQLEICKSSQLVDVDSTFEFSLDSRGLACISRNFERCELAGVSSIVEAGFVYEGLA